MYPKYIKAAAVSAAAIFVFSFYSFGDKNAYTDAGVLKTMTTELDVAITQLDNAAQAYKAGTITIDSLKQDLSQTRLAYKKVEFYLAFHFPEFTKENINGAPLFRIEKEGTRPKVITPDGLQVLDELIYSDEASEQKVHIGGLAMKLHSAFIDLSNGIGAPKMEGAYGIAALRMELVRILSMGITGFDTPGSLQALPEARASLMGMKLFYEENYSKDDAALKLFGGAIQYLEKNTDFDTFDRLVFIKEYIDPLYKTLATKQGKAPGFLSNTSAWNTNSQSVFAKDFLNPYYFTNISKDEDNEVIRSLGRTLFYDPALSGDGSVSCASCHKPELAFTDGQAKSQSRVQGKTVLRNSPTLLNAAYSDRYFYDLRAFTLEQQAEHVIFNTEEFNTAYSAILKKLSQKPEYATRFKKAFGKNGINRANFSKALASYVLSLQSFNSPMDKYLRGESAEISTSVKNGFNLFMGKAACATCHFAPTFSGLVPPLYSENESEILGVLKDPKAARKELDTDNGRVDNEIYTEYAWIYERSFKTSTVRNIALTAPYFHNGAYTTLEEVIDFYNEGGGEGMGFTVKNQTLAPDKLNLTPQEKKDLIAFMNALTDNSAAQQYK